MFEPSDSWDNISVEIPTVIYDLEDEDINKRYKMWYGGVGSISRDVSHPSVLTDGSMFFMIYGSFDSTKFETYTGLGLAFSYDGEEWAKFEFNPIFCPNKTASGEEVGISTGPSIIKIEDEYHLFYTGADKFGHRVINYAVYSSELRP